MFPHRSLDGLVPFPCNTYITAPNPCNLSYRNPFLSPRFSTRATCIRHAAGADQVRGSRVTARRCVDRQSGRSQRRPRGAGPAAQARVRQVPAGRLPSGRAGRLQGSRGNLTTVAGEKLSPRIRWNICQAFPKLTAAAGRPPGSYGHSNPIS